MQIVITIDTDNAAFEELGVENEVARILQRQVVNDLVKGALEDFDGLRLRDVNGNTVDRVDVRD